MPEWFKYECSKNDGMVTWVETWKDTTTYDELECETLRGIVHAD